MILQARRHSHEQSQGTALFGVRKDEIYGALQVWSTAEQSEPPVECN